MAKRITFGAVLVVTRKRYTFWITDTQAEALKRVKESEGTSESEQIRQALNEWLRKKGAIETGLRRVPSRRKP
jgi:Arc/MetJ-type ribon-helix-helix transcriptional regulator